MPMYFAKTNAHDNGEYVYHRVSRLKSFREVYVLPNKKYREYEVVWSYFDYTTWEPYEQLDMDCGSLIEIFWDEWSTFENEQWIAAGRPESWVFSRG